MSIGLLGNMNIKISPSTFFVVLSMILMWSGTEAWVDIEEQVLQLRPSHIIFIVFILWPGAALTGVVWSCVNWARSRSPQFAVELFLGTLLLLFFLFSVTRSP